LLQAIKTEIEAARSTALPASALGKACHYTLGQWPKLTRFLGYSRTGVEQQPGGELDAARGRGTQELDPCRQCQAGPKIAAILSVVETCRRMKLRLRDYLAAVLPGLADLPIQRVAELTPVAWSARNR
jgi:transposase